MEENKIREARLQAGLSQTELCKLLDIPIGTLKNWEQGRTKVAPYIVKLIIYFLEKERKSSMCNQEP